MAWHYTLSEPGAGRSRMAGVDARAIGRGTVYRKVVRSLAENGRKEVAFYQRADGSWDHCDFGTTCTCAIVMNAPDERNPNRK
eukprot:3803894-Rhodomonas_salina.1